MPPSDETASTSVSAPWNCATRAIPATSLATPVDVSPYASETALMFECRDKRSLSSSGSASSSQLVEYRCTTSPYDSANPAHISPNLPLQHIAISSPAEKRLQIVASSAPRPVV